MLVQQVRYFFLVFTPTVGLYSSSHISAISPNVIFSSLTAYRAGAAAHTQLHGLQLLQGFGVYGFADGLAIRLAAYGDRALIEAVRALFMFAARGIGYSSCKYESS
jgi:hypothetical protein